MFKTLLFIFTWPLLIIGVMAAVIHMGIAAGYDMGIRMLAGKDSE
jgi:hypothetical protein